MKITVIQERTPALLAQLTAVWEASVKATHTFLSAGEREQIKECVPQALAQVPCLLAAWAAPDKPVGFLGIAGRQPGDAVPGAGGPGQGPGQAPAPHRRGGTTA